MSNLKICLSIVWFYASSRENKKNNTTVFCCVRVFPVLTNLFIFGFIRTHAHNLVAVDQIECDTQFCMKLLLESFLLQLFLQIYLEDVRRRKREQTTIQKRHSFEPVPFWQYFSFQFVVRQKKTVVYTNISVSRLIVTKACELYTLYKVKYIINLHKPCES